MNKFDLMIGANVYCRDGKFGKLVKVVIEPETQYVKNLIVEKGFLTKRHRVFPISLVSAAADGEVHLLLTNAEWANYPAYKEEDYEILPASWKQRPFPEPTATTIQALDPYELDGSGILAVRSEINTEASAPEPGNHILPLLLFALLAFSLSACTGLAVEPLDSDEESAATAEGTAIAPTLTPAALDCAFLPETIGDGEAGVVVPEGAVVVVQKSGGVAGITEAWVIDVDGQITTDSGEQLQAPPQTVEALIALANQSGFYDLSPSYVPQDTCCDRFTYTITVRDCEQVHTVTAVENTPEVPEVVWDLIRSLEALLSGSRQQL